MKNKWAAINNEEELGIYVFSCMFEKRINRLAGNVFFSFRLLASIDVELYAN